MAKVGGPRINKPDGISIHRQREILGYHIGNLRDKAMLVAFLKQRHPEYFMVGMRKRRGLGVCQ